MSIDMLLHDKKFRPLFWTQFLGALNDNLLKNSLVLLVEYQGLSLLGLDPPSLVALGGAIFILPFFLFSMVAGQMADRFEKSKMVRLIKAWELLITIVAAFGYMNLNIYLLLTALFMMGTHSAFFGPIKYSALPELVPANKLLTSNAYVEVGTFLAILLGTIGGGLLIGADRGTVWIAIAINVCALLGNFTSYFMPELPSHSPHLKIRINPIPPMLETMRRVKQTPGLLHSIYGISWFWFFGAALLSILPPYCKEFLQVDAQVITLFLAIFTIGIGLGSMLCARLSKGRVVLGMVIIGAVGMSCFLLDLCVTQFRAVETRETLMGIGEFLRSGYGPRLIFDFLMLSVFGGCFVLPLYTAMQVRSFKEDRSRVVALNNVINSIYIVAAAVFVLLFHRFGFLTSETFLVLAGLNVFVMAYMCWSVPEFMQSLIEWWNSRGKI